MRDYISGFKQRAGIGSGDKIDIVAHSFGGLVARTFIEDLGGDTDVRRLIMLGTPNEGTPLAGITSLAGELNVTFRTCPSFFGLNLPQADRALRDMDPARLIAFNLRYLLGPPSTAYNVVAGTGDNSWLWPDSLVENDCIVNVGSADGPGGVFPTDKYPVKHLAGRAFLKICPTDASVTPMYSDQTCVLPRVLAILSGTFVQPCPAAAAAAVQTASATASNLAMALNITGQFATPGTATATAPVDGSVGQETFFLAWSDSASALHLELRRPDGSPVGIADPGVTYLAPEADADGFMREVYAIDQTIDESAPGSWAVDIVADSVAPGGASYQAGVLLTSQVGLSLAADMDEYDVGDPIGLQAILVDGKLGIMGATVNASITRPDATVDSLSLFDDGLHGDGSAGDGVYGATYANTGACGFYRIQVLANGTATGGSFVRVADTAIPVRAVGDIAGDVCSADDDADGCTDQQELGGNESLGGRRDPLYFWDVFDTNFDRAVAFADFLLVLQHFNTNDNGGAAAINRNTDPLSPAAETAAGVYSPRYDRGGQAPGGDPWDELPPDGSIAFGDFLSLLRQFGHSCA